MGIIFFHLFETFFSNQFGRNSVFDMYIITDNDTQKSQQVLKHVR